jgi:hypothetical protein
MPPPSNPAIFTDQEIEKMRLYVTEHDKRTSPNTFDLNNPPRKNYVHQEYPRIVYSVNKQGNSIEKKVHDQDEHEDALSDGWNNAPQAAAEPTTIELDAASAEEAAAFDKRLAEVKKAKAAKLAKK